MTFMISGGGRERLRRVACADARLAFALRMCDASAQTKSRRGIMTEPVKNGDRVRVHYTGRLGDGRVFDSSREGDPLEFTVGTGEVIPGFDDGVRGMKVGE